MDPYYRDEWCELFHGDCREILREVRGVTACVTDPPYGLSFMGKEWDHGIPGEQFWKIIMESCLPGAMLLAFGGTRTYHRLVCAIEDAGWEVRDCLMWIYGSGFPKSLDVSKGIDRAAGVERAIVGVDPNAARRNKSTTKFSGCYGEIDDSTSCPLTAPATAAARTWQGYGTALKPAYEPICLAMKPLDGTFARNAVEHGVAGLNVDGCRVQGDAGSGVWGSSNDGCQEDRVFNASPSGEAYHSEEHSQGRWPPNVIHDGSEEVLTGFPDTKSGKPGIKHKGNDGAAYGAESRPPGTMMSGFGDSGTAARFFYCAKASKAERNRGCDRLDERDGNKWNSGGIGERRRQAGLGVSRNDWPTVKPLALMRWLLTLVTMPERNLILDAFAGSGSTGVACKELWLKCVLIEEDEHACEIAAARIAATTPTPVQTLLAL